MKRIIIISIIAVIGGLSAMAQNNPVNNQTPTTKDHRNFIVDDQYLNITMFYNEENGEIVVNGLGESEGYLVNVVKALNTQSIVITDFVSADNNTIDVSMLANAMYIAQLKDPISGRTAVMCRFTVDNGFPQSQMGGGISGKSDLITNLKK